MPGVFIGSTELTDVGDIKIGATDVQEVYVGATKVFPVGGGVQTFFSWNPEINPELPDATFTRLGSKTASTTTDGILFFDQTLVTREIGYTLLRREENIQSLSGIGNYSASGGAVKDSDTQATFPGLAVGEALAATIPSPQDGQIWGFRVRMRLQSGSGPFDIKIVHTGTNKVQTVNLTTSFQTFFVSDTLPVGVGFAIARLENTAAGGPTAGVIEFEEVQVTRQGNIDTPPSYVDAETIYNAGNNLIDGVRILGTINANTVDGNGVVTENVGADLAGGGYFPEPTSPPDELTTTAAVPAEEIFTIISEITMPAAAPASNVTLFGWEQGGYIIRLNSSLQLQVSDGGVTQTVGTVNTNQRYSIRYARDLTQRVFQLDADSPQVLGAPAAGVGKNWAIGHNIGGQQPSAIFHNVTITDDPP